jgi:probable F420-dependent oxidoreductase
MKFGVSVSNFGAFGRDKGVDGCLRVAQRADELGFDSVWVADHVIIPGNIQARYPYNETGRFGRTWEADVYEPLVLMNALAAITSHVRIGVGVLVIPYRHPAITAKMLTTADLLSNGRIILGAGVGWMRDEFEALGLPPGHFEHRGSVTNEYLQAIKEMWTNTGPSSFVGRYVQFHNAGTFPKPVQKPHPPIWVGGKGEAAMLRAVRLGNGFHAVAADPDQLGAEVLELHRLCRSDRRDPEELEVSLTAGIRLMEQPYSDGPRPLLTGSPDQIVEDLHRYAKAGLHHMVGTPSLEGERDPLERVIKGMQLMAREVLHLFR